MRTIEGFKQFYNPHRRKRIKKNMHVSTTYNADKCFHTLDEMIRNRKIRFHDFHEAGIDEDYSDWYYAEDGLYIIHDRISDSIQFVHAGSPEKALECVYQITSDMRCFDEDEE